MLNKSLIDYGFPSFELFVCWCRAKLGGDVLEGRQDFFFLLENNLLSSIKYWSLFQVHPVPVLRADAVLGARTEPAQVCVIHLASLCLPNGELLFLLGLQLDLGDPLDLAGIQLVRGDDILEGLESPIEGVGREVPLSIVLDTGPV